MKPTTNFQTLSAKKNDIGMKIKITFFILLSLFLVSLSHKSFACDYCNKQFAKELNGKRSGTLLSKEMLLAMNNQAPLPAPVTGNTDFKPQTNPMFPQIMERDEKLPIPPTSFVPQNSKADVTCKISLEEGETYIGKGVMFKGFTTDKKIPGPTFFATEGDIVEFIVENRGKIPHGASLHMAYTQTSKYLGKIEPEKSKTFKFRVPYPGVYLYHCAPGGHAIPMHILFGQYGMMVVKPKKKFRMEEVMGKKPDVEIYLIQHEFYSSGKDAVEGHPLYTVFNGKIFRYVDEPIKAKPGDFVRIYFLNAGPNLISTFHIVGILWDFAYWQGNPENTFTGGQSVLAGPTDSWIVDFRMPPDEGAYLMLSHAVGSTDRGAIGLLMCDKNAITPVQIKADGPEYTEQELAELRSKSIRTVSPFEPGTPDVDPFVVYGPDAKEVTVKIIGNSFFPKRIQISKGTKVRWLNEDVFSYFEGEYAGIHDVFSILGADKFKSPLLAHAETFVHEFKTPGEMKYICTPHPYMRGEISVVESNETSSKNYWSMSISVLAIVIALGLFFKRK